MNEAPEILYEDDDVLVIAKPAGMAMYGASTVSTTVAEWFHARVPAARTLGADPVRGGLVHRLDRDTSGVLILAKTAHAYGSLAKQFRARKVSKVYRALAYGAFRAERGVIDKPIGRSRTDPRRRTAMRGAVGVSRPAVTHWRVLASYPDTSVGPLTYLELYPHTGRTHQLRVHLQSVSHPVVCDALYAVGRECPGALARQALHAYALTVRLPRGEERTFTAPLPADLQKTLDVLESHSL